MDEQELREALHQMAGAPTASEGPSPALLMSTIDRRRRAHLSVMAVASIAAVLGLTAGVRTLLAAEPSQDPLVGDSPSSAVSSTESSEVGCGTASAVVFGVTAHVSGAAGSADELAARYTLSGETYHLNRASATLDSVLIETSAGVPRVLLELQNSEQGWSVVGTTACVPAGFVDTCGASVMFNSVSYLAFDSPPGTGPGTGRVLGEATVSGCGVGPVGPVTAYSANEESPTQAVVVTVDGQPQLYTPPSPPT
jgi:hypothetical protein